jgi:transposase InsO family protein
MAAIRRLAVQMAKENPGWGYTRIVGALANLGHKVARTTVADILKHAGIKPAPQRPTSWRTFLKAHAGVLCAADFLSVEVWTARGLVTHYVLFAIDIGSRMVEVLGITPHPDSDVMAQVARNVTDPVDGFLRRKRYFLIDRDSKFDARFRRILRDAGIQIVRTVVCAPNMNAFAERFVRTIKDECLAKIIFFGEGMLRRAVSEFVEHYHRERNHQGIDNEVPQPEAEPMPRVGKVVRKERLGGLLSFYHRRRSTA